MPVEKMSMSPASLPDISGRFEFKEGNRSGGFFKEASGYLGIPGEVLTHRDIHEQRAVSTGTGNTPDILSEFSLEPPVICATSGCRTRT